MNQHSHRQVVSPQIAASSPSKKPSNKKLFAIVAVLVIGGLAFSTFYFWRKYRAIIKNPNIVAQEEAKAITEKIGKFMDLPEDETPDLAKVSNKEKLVGQPFFQK